MYTLSLPRSRLLSSSTNSEVSAPGTRTCGTDCAPSTDGWRNSLISRETLRGECVRSFLPSLKVVVSQRSELDQQSEIETRLGLHKVRSKVRHHGSWRAGVAIQRGNTA